MYCVKRTVSHDKVAYLKYDGWCIFSNAPLDLTGVILFTKGEAKANELPPEEEFQWYGAYKRG